MDRIKALKDDMADFNKRADDVIQGYRDVAAGYRALNAGYYLRSDDAPIDEDRVKRLSEKP